MADMDVRVKWRPSRGKARRKKRERRGPKAVAQSAFNRSLSLSTTNSFAFTSMLSVEILGFVDDAAPFRKRRPGVVAKPVGVPDQSAALQ
jgi:hypothetical protein